MATKSGTMPMQKLIGTTLFLMMFAAGSGTASAAPWCAYYDAYTYNCGFRTFEQCLATISGAGGFCQRNPYEQGRPERRTHRRYRRY
jgi:hypothetical protein